jgi:hypothetical protein
MDFDLPGRIKNTKLPVSGALLPILEAVVNSIQAVDEAPHPENGVIRVHLERDLAQQSFPSEVVGVVLGPVRSVTIRDNGIGFTDVHYKSFCTADTRQKASIGGKGIGRFLWLKAFDHAEIESTFRAPDGKHYRRKFTLGLTTVGVEDHALAEIPVDEPVGTSVRLCDYRPEFQAEVPHSSETVGRKIVEHCLEHFVLGLAPAIYLHDSGSEQVHDLNEMFEAEVKVTTTVGKFKLGVATFRFTICVSAPAIREPTDSICVPTIVPSFLRTWLAKSQILWGVCAERTVGPLCMPAMSQVPIWTSA